jgi:endo-1,4-beta-xylanase
MTSFPDKKNFAALNRREFLCGLGMTAGALLAAPMLGACSTLPPVDVCTLPSDGLRQRAQSIGRHFGIATQSSFLSNQQFACAIAREANMLVPEGELKWRFVQPDDGAFDFSGYDKLQAFATQHGMTMRGHTLLWHRALPDWALERLNNRDRVEDMLATHINAVMKHTAPHITDWDVVNEAVRPEMRRIDGLRDSPWMHALGPYYIELAFTLAAAANPNARLVYNDFDFEFAHSRKRRRSVLGLLEHLKKRNVPVHALGLQSHLACHRPLGGRDFTDFLREVRAMGIEVIVTELDVSTRKLTGSDTDIAQAAANYTRQYIDLLQHDAPLDTLLSWGLSSRYTYLRGKEPIVAPLPLDADMQRLPLWHVLHNHWLGRVA